MVKLLMTTEIRRNKRKTLLIPMMLRTLKAIRPKLKRKSKMVIMSIMPPLVPPLLLVLLPLLLVFSS
eukprot:jgi/Orpsp1_1/1182106/evm.model.c7180000079918.1